jgi:hypothetical protein
MCVKSWILCKITGKILNGRPEPTLVGEVRIEMFKAEMARHGWQTDRFIILNNMAGYRIMKHATPHAMILLKHMVEIVQSLYRDSVEKIIVLNAPGIFQGFWNIIKKWLKPETAKRVVFVNDLVGLTEFIAPENLFEEL